MKKQYELPQMEVQTFDYDVITESDTGTGDIYGDDWQDGTIMPTGWVDGGSNS